MWLRGGTTSFAVSFAVNEQIWHIMKHVNQAVEPIEGTWYLISSRVPPSAPHNVSGKARCDWNHKFAATARLCFQFFSAILCFRKLTAKISATLPIILSSRQGYCSILARQLYCSTFSSGFWPLTLPIRVLSVWHATWPALRERE
jgi:hypothetical protein